MLSQSAKQQPSIQENSVIHRRDSSSVCVMHYELSSQTSQQSAVFSLRRGLWRIVNKCIAAEATTACLVIADGFTMLCHSYIISLYGHFTASVGLN
jgi:hypothetical protein